MLKFISNTIPVSFIKSNKGLNQNGNPINLTNDESSNLQNINFDAFGALVKRNGYKHLNTTKLGNIIPDTPDVDDGTVLLIKPDESEGVHTFTDLTLNSVVVSAQGFDTSAFGTPGGDETAYSTLSTYQSQSFWTDGFGARNKFATYFPDYLQVNGESQGNLALSAALESSCWIDGFIKFESIPVTYVANVLYQTDTRSVAPYGGLYWSAWRFYKVADDYTMRLDWREGGAIFSVTASLSAWTVDTWYSFMFERIVSGVTSTYKFYFNGVLMGTDTAGIPPSRDSYIWVGYPIDNSVPSPGVDRELLELYNVRVSTVSRTPFTMP